MRHIAAVMLAVLALAGCGGKTPVTQTVPEPSVTTSATRTAGEIATEMGIGPVTVWTAATDKNQLLGRPGGYTSAATITDRRVSCTPDPDTSCGATVEVYPTEGEALARSQYIQSILAGQAWLGTEYHTIQGSALLRVTGQLTPEQAKVYADKFKVAAQH
jgi:alkanesulfonate monooxygenase SsuD/methylene tetrahydromethanopterin reductase-like flavin-dependent oxidoreductase (luciferase family)